jgi:hypothetical protein
VFNFLLLKGYSISATVCVDTLQNMAALVAISKQGMEYVDVEADVSATLPRNKSCVGV